MKLPAKLEEDIRAIGMRVVYNRGITYITGDEFDNELWHMEYDFELFYLYEHGPGYESLVDTFNSFDAAYNAAKDLT